MFNPPLRYPQRERRAVKPEEKRNEIKGEMPDGCFFRAAGIDLTLEGSSPIFAVPPRRERDTLVRYSVVLVNGEERGKEEKGDRSNGPASWCSTTRWGAEGKLRKGVGAVTPTRPGKIGDHLWRTKGRGEKMSERVHRHHPSTAPSRGMETAVTESRFRRWSRYLPSTS